jgi:hypothetical protein
MLLLIEANVNSCWAVTYVLRVRHVFGYCKLTFATPECKGPPLLAQAQSRTRGRELLAHIGHKFRSVIEPWIAVRNF